jgi:hypothetical protein
MPIVRRTRLFTTACVVCLVVLAVVVWSWDVSSVHSVKVVIRISFHVVHTAYVPAPHDNSQQNQADTTCSLKQSCSPDDGHNNARNMLRVY